MWLPKVVKLGGVIMLIRLSIAVAGATTLTFLGAAWCIRYLIPEFPVQASIARSKPLTGASRAGESTHCGIFVASVIRIKLLFSVLTKLES
jgi:hypothetical protein